MRKSTGTDLTRTIFSSVRFFAVFHCGNVHEEVVVINFVKDAVGTLTNSVPAAMKLLDSRGSRVLSKLIDSGLEWVLEFLGH